MLKRVAICSGVIGLAIAFGSGEAFAQSSTNCMAMGPNMVHCDTMDMGQQSANQTANQNDGGYLLGKGIGELIVSIRETNFRKKIGKLLANGDCHGAARLALESGRLELGQSISATCRPNVPPVANLPPEPSSNALEGALHQIADNARVPMGIGQNTTIIRVDAVGKVLLLAANVSGQANSVSPMQYADMKNAICTLEPQYKILRAGASVEVSYFSDTPESAGRIIGSLAVNGRDCGL